MSTIHVRCPVIGRRTSTGMIVDEATFEALTGEMRRTRCPLCAEVHGWSAREIWLTRTFELEEDAVRGPDEGDEAKKMLDGAQRIQKRANSMRQALLEDDVASAGVALPSRTF